MPQFNWSVVAPVALLVAAIVGGSFFLLQHSPHPAAQPGLSAAVRPALGAAPGLPSTPAGGVRLSGRVVGTPHLRPEPSSNAIVLQDLQVGQTVEVSGCSPSCGWYLITPQGQTTPGWVPAAFISIQGDDRRLPVLH